MRARRFLPLAVAALVLGPALLTTPAMADAPSPPPTDHPPAFVSIEEGPGLSFPRSLGIKLRYTCYGGPTTVDVTVTAGVAQASGSAAIPCKGQVDLPVGLGLTVPEDAAGLPPGAYFVEVRASIPGQASLVAKVEVEGPPALAPVFVIVDASPEEVIKGRNITVFGVIRRGSVGEPFSARTALEFRPDGGGWR